MTRETALVLSWLSTDRRIDKAQLALRDPAEVFEEWLLGDVLPGSFPTPLGAVLAHFMGQVDWPLVRLHFGAPQEDYHV